jgi:hypothetical protein
MPSDAGTVRVVVRIRPQNQIELKRGGLECVKLLSDTEVEVGCDDGDFRYTFDRILGPKVRIGTICAPHRFSIIHFLTLTEHPTRMFRMRRVSNRR